MFSLPEHLSGEFYNGELLAVPRPGYPHQYAGGGIFGDLCGFFMRRSGGGEKGWVFIQDVLINHPKWQNPRAPDISGWRKHRPPKLKKIKTNKSTYTLSETIPDWVCEILSPSTAGIDLKEKKPEYGEAGIKYLWLVDPVNQYIRSFRRKTRKRKETEDWWKELGCYVGDEKARIEPFEELELDLSLLWFREE